MKQLETMYFLALEINEKKSKNCVKLGKGHTREGLDNLQQLRFGFQSDRDLFLLNSLFCNGEILKRISYVPDFVLFHLTFSPSFSNVGTFEGSNKRICSTEEEEEKKVKHFIVANIHSFRLLGIKRGST